MLLESFLRDVYVPLRLRGRSPNSIRLLAHAIRQFGLWLGRPAVISDLDDLVIARFLTARGATISPHSVARERSGLVALWNLANARGLVRLRPCVALEVVPEQIPRAFTADELHRLVASASKANGYIGPVAAATFWRALIGTLLESGERISAVLAAPKSGWTRPFLAVPATIRKGRRAGRVYELSPETSALVDAASRHDLPTLFAWDASPTALYKRWRVITRRAGLGDGRDIQFHALRRTTASHLVAAGHDATSYLGHASERTTRRSYIDPRIVEAGRPAAFSVLPRPLLPPPLDNFGTG